ncbi:MAG: hypothetical protein AAF378_08335 [Cyanobacteria bacterium P01_A01_bin.84]
MPQARVTISDELDILAKKLIQTTGCGNHGSLYGLLLTRYGSHLSQTWHVTTFEEPKRLIYPIPEPNSKPVQPEYTEHPEVVDPVIARISGLVDNF